MNSSHRRRFLRAVAGATTIGLAGCASDSGEEPTDEADQSADQGGEDTETEEGQTSEENSEESVSPGSWPMPLYDAQNTRYAPKNEGPRSGVVEDWSTELPEPNLGMPNIIAADKTLYVGHHKNIFAFDVADGSENWAYPVDGYIGSIAVIDGTVYAESTNESKLIAIDAAEGTKLWEDGIQIAVDQIRPSNGAIIISGTVDSTKSVFLSYDIDTGEENWSFRVEGELSEDWATPSPAVTDDVVYAVGIDRKIYAIDRSNGEKLWSAEKGEKRSALSVSEGVVYFLSRNNLIALDGDTGEHTWSFETHNGDAELDLLDEFKGSPAIADGVIYFGTYHLEKKNKLYAINANDQTEEWSVQLPSGFNAAKPLVAGDTVYVNGIYNNMYSFSLNDGESLWQHDIDAEISRPVLVDDSLYFGTKDRKVISLSEA